MSRYSEQYQHPNWQKKRLEMLTEANFRCELCHDTETQLHVHHRFYRSGAKVWEYENYELAVLCELCHSLIHGKIPNLFEKVISLGLTHAALLDFEGAKAFQKYNQKLILRFNLFGPHIWFEEKDLVSDSCIGDPDLFMVLNSKSHVSVGPNRFQYNPLVRAFLAHSELIGMRDFASEREIKLAESMIEAATVRMMPLIFPYYCPEWDQAGKVRYDDLKPLREIYPRRSK